MTFNRSLNPGFALGALLVLALFFSQAAFCASTDGAISPPTGNFGPAQVSINVLPDGRAAVYMNTSLGQMPVDFDFWVSQTSGPVSSVSDSGVEILPATAPGNPGTVARFQNASGTIHSAFYLLNPLEVPSGNDVYSLDLNMTFSHGFSPVTVIITAPENSSLVSTSGLVQDGGQANAVLYSYPQALAGDNLAFSVQLRPSGQGMFGYARVIEQAAPPRQVQVSSGSYSLSLSTPVSVPAIGKVPLYSILIAALFIIACAFFILKTLARARSSMRPDDPDRPWTFEPPSDYPEQDSGVKEVLVSPQEGIVAKPIREIVRAGSERAVFADSPKWQDGPEPVDSEKEAKMAPEISKSEEAEKPAPKPSAAPEKSEEKQPVVQKQDTMPEPVQEAAKPSKPASVETREQAQHGKVNMVRLSMPPKEAKQAKPSQALGYFAKLFGQKAEPKPKPDVKPEPAHSPAVQDAKPEQSVEEAEIIAEVKKFRSGIQLARLKKYMIMKPAAFNKAFDSAVSGGSLEVFDKKGTECVRIAGRGKKAKPPSAPKEPAKKPEPKPAIKAKPKKAKSAKPGKKKPAPAMKKQAKGRKK